MKREGYVLKKHGGVRVSVTDPTFMQNARRFARGAQLSTRDAWSPSMKRA
jgi:hypothetical protein